MRWRRFLDRRQRDAELQQEIALHLKEEIAENIERGMTPDEARRRAYVKFGNARRVREEIWQANSFLWVERMWGDLRYVVRRLRKAPSAVLTVMVSLGLGIAANVVVFSGVDKMALQGPPVGEPANLMSVYSTGRRWQAGSLIDTKVFESMRGQLRSFSGAAGFTSFLQATLSGRGEPERAWGQSVTVNYFDVAEVPMVLGRGFGPHDEHAPVVVLSYSLWVHFFHADKGVVGKTMSLSGKPFTVIGVAKPGFHGILQLMNSEFWVPLSQQAEMESVPGRNGESVNVIARFAPRVGRTKGQAELDTVAQRLMIQFPKERQGQGFYIERAGTMPAAATAEIATFLAGVMVVALLVLSIAGSNIANLLLSRAMARHREMAIRIALGGTRWQLMRPMLLESMLLSLGGGVFGVGVSLLAMRALMVFHMPVNLPIDLILNVDKKVLIYAFFLSVGTGMLCGLGPAFAATQPSVPSALKGESALERPGRRWTMRSVLVVVQVATCVVLLCTTGLYLHSLAKFAHANSGLRISGVRMLSIDPIHNGYRAEQVPLVLKRVRERVTAMPQVMTSAWTDAVPLSIGMRGNKFHLTGRTGNFELDPRADVYDVEPGYFSTMGIERIEGRDFIGAGPDAPKQMVVNEAFAHLMFKERSAMGESLSPTWPPNLGLANPPAYEIVGVVKNSKSAMMSDEENHPIAYEELDQNMGISAPLLGYSLMVHYQGNGAEVANGLRNEVHSVDSSLGIFNEKEMVDQVTDSLIIPRAESAIFGTFGGVGLLLAAVGLYSVMSYSVERRTQEIGIRLALGATRGGVQGLIVRQGMMLAVIALAIGLPLALAASKIAARLQEGIAAYDAVSFTLMPLFLASVALAACWIPARRAATVDPQIALRHE
jgi:predicted permease